MPMVERILGGIIKHEVQTPAEWEAEFDAADKFTFAAARAVMVYETPFNQRRHLEAFSLQQDLLNLGRVGRWSILGREIYTHYLPVVHFSKPTRH